MQLLIDPEGVVEQNHLNLELIMERGSLNRVLVLLLLIWNARFDFSLDFFKLFIRLLILILENQESLSLVL